MIELLAIAAAAAINQLLNILFKAAAALPVWFFWTYCEMGKKYGLGILPEVLHSPSLLDWIGLFIIVPLLLALVLTPFGALSAPRQ